MTVEDDSSLRAAARLARLGGWSVDIADMKLTWTGETASIHEELPGFSPELMQAFHYIAPEFRDTLRLQFEACVASGAPYSCDAQMIAAKGRRIWIRAFGEAVKDANEKVATSCWASTSFRNSKRPKAPRPTGPTAR